jgi:hypothetical protein
MLKSSHSDVDYECRHKDGRTDHNEKEKHALLKCVQGGQIDRVEAGQCHSAHGQEQRICVADAPRRSGGPPKYYACQKTCCNEVNIVECNEVQSWNSGVHSAGEATERCKASNSGKQNHAGVRFRVFRATRELWIRKEKFNEQLSERHGQPAQGSRPMACWQMHEEEKISAREISRCMLTARISRDSNISGEGYCGMNRDDNTGTIDIRQWPIHEGAARLGQRNIVAQGHSPTARPTHTGRGRRERWRLPRKLAPHLWQCISVAVRSLPIGTSGPDLTYLTYWS